MKKINFTKMQSLGNDFIIIDQIKNAFKINKNNFKINKNNIKKIASRNYGIGCDQLLILETSNKKNIQFKYKIYNQDGSESGQCGNGAKCVAKYYFDKYGRSKEEINIETITNKMSLKIIKRNFYEVDMGKPSFKDTDLKINTKIFPKNNIFLFNKKKYLFSWLSIGNPHVIFLIKNIDKIDFLEFSRQFNIKNYFNKGVNISIVQKLNGNKYKARIFERGSGETLACGSAACAITVSMAQKTKKYNKYYIYMKGGKAEIKWNGDASKSVYLYGTGDYVYEGEYKIK